MDITLFSACKVWKSNIIAVILTGMGHDGLDGCRQVKKEGGYVIAQDEESSVANGINKSVITNHLADVITQPEHIMAHVNLYLRKLN